jgi:hypothetical protein
MSAAIGAITMTNTIKQITFTSGMIGKGSTAMGDQDTADASKLAFFKSIKRRVPRDQIANAKPAFESVAYAYFDKKHKLNGKLIEAIVKGELKETTVIGPMTIRKHKDAIRHMATRWSKYYAKWLDTGEINKVGGKAGAKKRTTGGATKPKQVDTVAVNPAEEPNPVKRAIERVSSIPSMILKETKPSQADEGLRQEIEIAAMQLVELLGRIK